MLTRAEAHGTLLQVWGLANDPGRFWGTTQVGMSWSTLNDSFAAIQRKFAEVNELVTQPAQMRSLSQRQQLELDPAGVPKVEPTLLESQAIAVLNTIKAWYDSDRAEPFPAEAREGMEALLMMATVRLRGIR